MGPGWSLCCRRTGGYGRRSRCRCRGVGNSPGLLGLCIFLLPQFLPLTPGQTSSSGFRFNRWRWARFTLGGRKESQSIFHSHLRRVGRVSLGGCSLCWRSRSLGWFGNRSRRFRRDSGRWLTWRGGRYWKWGLGQGRWFESWRWGRRFIGRDGGCGILRCLCQ